MLMLLDIRTQGLPGGAGRGCDATAAHPGFGQDADQRLLGGQEGVLVVAGQLADEHLGQQLGAARLAVARVFGQPFPDPGGNGLGVALLLDVTQQVIDRHAGNAVVLAARKKALGSLARRSVCFVVENPGL
ncbi:hypothetical protein G6F57_021238 [Rhizopus arrhizus]|nr:hypothetical protein G6F57_021238 [Rhizopus arrhizus]